MDIQRKHSIEQAIKIAQENKTQLLTKNINEDLSDVVQFVLALDIREGKIKVPAKVLYESYNNWSMDPMNKDSFFKELSTLLPRIEAKAIYLLNYQPAELLRESSK